MTFIKFKIGERKSFTNIKFFATDYPSTFYRIQIFKTTPGGLDYYKIYYEGTNVEAASALWSEKEIGDAFKNKYWTKTEKDD